MSEATSPKLRKYELPIDESAIPTRVARSTPRIVGLFDFNDSRGIWKLCGEDPQVMSIIEDWYDESIETHRIMSGERSWDRFMSLATDARYHDAVRIETHPTANTVHHSLYFGYQPKSILLWYIVRLVKARPELFSDSTVEPFSLHIKDVFKGWKFLTWTRAMPLEIVFREEDDIPFIFKAIKPAWKVASPTKPRFTKIHVVIFIRLISMDFTKSGTGCMQE
ncbi:hypothetical protein BDV19DRAFT_390490 [Aspergillus venezuelensis]